MKNKNIDYDSFSITYENNINTAKKKDFGIFYTDYSLAYRMVEELSINKYSTVLDPCCGTGVFLETAKDCGCKNVFGCDIDKGAVDICIRNFHKAIVCDSIFDDFNDVLKRLNITTKVDYIIGNPPYATVNDNNCINSNIEIYNMIKNYGNNLFVGSILQSINMLNEKGILSYIIPKNFLHVSAYRDLRRLILEHYDILEIIDLGAHFKNVRGEQIILTIQNCKTNNNRILFKKSESNSFELLTEIPQSFYSDEIMIFSTAEDYIVYNKLNKNKCILRDYENIKIHRGHSKSVNAVKGRDIRKYGFKNNRVINTGNQLFIQNIYSAESGSIATFGGDMEAGETITVLTTDNKEECKVLLALLHSSIWNLFLYKFCYNSSKLTMHTDAKYLYRIPMPNNKAVNKYMSRILDYVEKIENEEYMSNKWFDIYHKLDDIINLLYNINKQDTLYINQEMSKIQSKRWN